MNCQVNRLDSDMAVALQHYGLDLLLPTLGHHSMLGTRGDILDVSTPFVGALPFDGYAIREADHECYRYGSDFCQERLRRSLAYG
ncbi:hypothetical protein CDL12_22897 [Handroanthus impetiginosus]|uniref:Uncharacterized protein n=1 Tax=Handroanthus impetiginosus TaxID=429701 RepID=A0A2G9G4J8_9LAMI|nr:hypothetical protein CDL12_27262 [Handroanthus impetiginosus]PIN04570.1 hypothetical protein CDL12_22897 [Handroanthus impetiginosus]